MSSKNRPAWLTDAMLETVIDEFYARVTRDPLLAPFFRGVDLSRIRKMQYEFFSIALEGHAERSPFNLREIHAGLNIETIHLSSFTEHLLDTLIAQGMQPTEADKVVARIAMYADDITGDTGGVDG